ncbi:MAG: hypothetical protein R2759_06185 [Bacteroidales bacterium]
MIGRLLYDSKSIFEDQLESVKRASIKKGNEQIDLALVTDGLRAEREQGITVLMWLTGILLHLNESLSLPIHPVMFSYTRNMVTGVSTANAALIPILMPEMV